MKYYIKRCHKDIGSDVVSGCKINLFSGIFCCFLQQEWKMFCLCWIIRYGLVYSKLYVHKKNYIYTTYRIFY